MTTSIKRIVTATDFSPAGNDAVMRGAFLARAMGVDTVCLWHVLEPAVGRVLRETLNLSLGDKKAFHDKAGEELEALARRVQGQTGVLPETDFLEGRITQALPGALKQGDLLVIGATGSHHLRSIMMGITAQRLLQCSSVPVLLTRQEPNSRYHKVLVATDFSPASQRSADLAGQLASEGVIRAVHAYQAFHEVDLIFAGVDDDVIEQYREKSKSEAGKKMKRWLAKHPSFKPELLPGFPLPVLLDQVEVHNADLLVVGKQGQNDGDSSLLGEVTQRLLNEAPCDVLVVG